MSNPVRVPHLPNFLVADYTDCELDEIPMECPWKCRGEACSVSIHHRRHRKTGPTHRLAVLRCQVHEHAFTAYPPGFVPYARRRLDEGPTAHDEPSLVEVLDDSTDFVWDGAEGRYWGTLRCHLDRVANPEQHARSWMETLSRGDVDLVLAELDRHSADVTSPGAERARQLRDHLTRFRNAVAYDNFVDRGMVVGSGEIESGHRHVTQRRLKIAGAWWTEENMDRIAALRCVRANGWWDEFCRKAA